MKKPATGTKEWSTSSINVSSGCAHDCLYCYARAQAIRFKRKTPATWCDEEINRDVLRKGFSKRKGRVMLPTTHDLTDATIEPVIAVARRLLHAGNELLIVSKPAPRLIERLLRDLQSWKYNARQLVEFRFTIGSYLDSTLRFWEPCAPTFAHRLASLYLARREGFKVSVSCEPMLEHRGRMVELVHMLEPIVGAMGDERDGSIWLGKMNQARARLKANGVKFDAELLRRLAEIERWQADGEISRLYLELKAHPLVRWKESIKRVVGLDLATEPGLDQ